MPNFGKNPILQSDSPVPFWQQLRIRLMIYFIALAVLPLLISISYLMVQFRLQTIEQVKTELETLSKIKYSEIREWLISNELVLDIFLAEHPVYDELIVSFTNDDLNASTNELLLQIVEASKGQLRYLFLYDASGKIMAASNPTLADKTMARQPYFEASLSGPHTEPPYYGPNNELTMVMTRPIYKDENQYQLAGVLVAYLDVATTLGEIMLAEQELTETSEAYLVSKQNNYLLTPSRFEEAGFFMKQPYHSDSITKALTGENGVDTYVNYRDASVIGAYRWIPELNAGLIAEIEEAEASSLFYDTVFNGGIIIVFFAVVAAGLGLVVANQISQPITQLTNAATAVAEGDLLQQIEVDQKGEIGHLASAFASMTTQMEELIISLEERVASRTHRLEIVADLGKELNSILEPNELLLKVVNQTKDQFGYYHAHIYLIQTAENKLVMEAGAGEIGQTMKTAGHSIALDAPKSLVAQAARSGETVMVENVQLDENWLPNPLLPDTHAEIAIPIWGNGEIIGVLDVQSEQLGGIDISDATLLRSISNQISVALTNARLFEQIQQRAIELANAREITEATKEELANHEKRLRLIYESSLDAIILFKRDTIIDCNTRTIELFGYQEKSIFLKTSLVSHTPHKQPDGRDSIVIMQEKIDLTLRRGNSHFEFLCRRYSGEAFPTETIMTSLEIDGEQLILSSIRDITERKQAEAEQERLLQETKQAKQQAEIANQAMEAQIWLSSGSAKLNNVMRGEQDIITLAGNVIHQLCEYIMAQVGILYIVEDMRLEMASSYAYRQPESLPRSFMLGEYLVGQVALEKRPITITDVPDDYIMIGSGLGQTRPRTIIISPFLYDDQVIGVVELGILTTFTENQQTFLQNAMENIAIAFITAQARAQIDELLLETQHQTNALQTQGEELRVANEELQSQTDNLRKSELQLREKQVELELANTELEEKASALEESSVALQQQQAALDDQNQQLEQKAEELALASKYKSEFLANMSHELRTPLNSLLILARMLADNEDGNLTDDEVEAAEIIYGGGHDLLNLINEILDLSKVEAGKMEFHFAPMPFIDLVMTMQLQFNHVAEEKGVTFETLLDEGLPTSIETDEHRVKQIVKNLLGNAFKFTDTGRVKLHVYRPDNRVDLSHSGLAIDNVIAISVIDTGIGMTESQQKGVFEAFRQADGSTSRQYGGTGLGLSISRELTFNLGGQIDVMSEPNQGSTFTLYLPIERNQASTGPEDEVQQLQLEITQSEASPINGHTTSVLPVKPTIPIPKLRLSDDRDNLEPDDKLLLIVEDDINFAKIVQDIAIKQSFKCLLADNGQTGLQLAQTYKPTAIILDLHLPKMDGWAVLDALKKNADTRHIPVHIMSVDDVAIDAYKKGAIGYLNKPVTSDELYQSFQTIEVFISKEIKTLLLVEDDIPLRRSVKKLLDGSDVEITEVGTAQTALSLLIQQSFDCMILDLNLPDMNGFDLLSIMDSDETVSKCPVIIYTGKDLTPEENMELMKYADSVIVKGARSPERLLDETTLFLHRVVADMPMDKQRAIKRLYHKEASLTGKHILLVDDDVRNSFALSKLLADKGVKVQIAPNGQKALDFLEQTPTVDLVLMDIMMPVLNGYETMKQIRAQSKFQDLPILALTAKAMKGDREKCIQAGANDYLAKPIDIDRLLSMLRVWLYK